MTRVLIFSLAMIASSFANEWENLWPHKAPGAKQPPTSSEKKNKSAHFTHIEVPQYKLYSPEKPNGQCIVVLPGGGYAILSMENEGTQIAKNLVKEGITVVVVKYRVSPNPRFGYQFPVPLLDARRAIRTARANASKWKIDPKRIGVMGFSAGGHLAACTATMFDEKFREETNDSIDSQSCRPDFAILGYPVILMGTKSGHMGSQDNLIGKSPSKKDLSKVKVVDFISNKTPPVYVIHSADDTLVPLRNSMEFMAVCAEHKVKVAGRIFHNGGHGSGAPWREQATEWMNDLHKWLKFF